MTTANENSHNHGGCCGGHGHHHGEQDASLEQRDLGLKDVHAEGDECGCAPGECQCGHHETCDCAPGECQCGRQHGTAEHGTAQHDAVQGGVPDHGDCECEQCKNADRERAQEAEKGCGCGCGHGEASADKDFTDPDTVNADGTNPAVRTVDKAEGYDENAGWNDGNLPSESGSASASGAGNNDEGQIN